MNPIFSFALTISLFIAQPSFSQSPKAVTEYINVPGPISFANDIHHLVWSTHPTDSFYKQEYLTAGDQPEHFSTMLLVDVVASPVTLREVVRAKMDVKQTDPLVNYHVFQKNGEYLLDFLLSQSSLVGKQPVVVEHNLYRYKAVVDKAGHRAVLLFGVSRRSYDQKITSFLTRLKANRSVYLRQISEFRLPHIRIDRFDC